MFVAQTLQGHVNHRHGALDDLFAGRNDGVGLLAAQHHGGDFGGIGQIVDAGIVGFQQHKARHADQHAETPDRTGHDRPDAERQPCVDTLRAEHDRAHTQRQPDEDQRQSQKTIAFPALVDKISILHIRKF